MPLILKSQHRSDFKHFLMMSLSQQGIYCIDLIKQYHKEVKIFGIVSNPRRKSLLEIQGNDENRLCLDYKKLQEYTMTINADNNMPLCCNITKKCSLFKYIILKKITFELRNSLISLN